MAKKNHAVEKKETATVSTQKIEENVHAAKKNRLAGMLFGWRKKEKTQEPVKIVENAYATGSEQADLSVKQPFLTRLFAKKKLQITLQDILKKKVEYKERPQRARERRRNLKAYFSKAGITLDADRLTKRIFDISIGIALLLSGLYIYSLAGSRGFTWFDIIVAIASLWLIGFAALIAVTWFIIYFIIDILIYKRKTQIEEVLPDYLQLTASNIKAGLTIDRALWYAVRPRFGVLAKEIEIVAKETMKGDDLKIALDKFANKYDSVILRRTVSLLLEGIESGGEVGNLLNKIAINIQENRIMRKEMAANVTTYVIFISFATIAAAPVLFSLSGVLIKVIASLGSSLGNATDSASGFGLMISFSGSAISYNDFKIFAIVSLSITSFFSSAIIATIVKGSAKAGFKYIPWFVVSTVALFLVADTFLGKLVGFVI